jgi:hypothetical protein
MAAPINTADRIFGLVIQFLHSISKANELGSSLEMEKHSTVYSNFSSRQFKAMRDRCDHLSPRAGEVSFCIRLRRQGRQSKASPLPDIGRAMASVRLRLADATLAAAANEVAGKPIGPRVGNRQI